MVPGVHLETHIEPILSQVQPQYSPLKSPPVRIWSTICTQRSNWGQVTEGEEAQTGNEKWLIQKYYRFTTQILRSFPQTDFFSSTPTIGYYINSLTMNNLWPDEFCHFGSWITVVSLEYFKGRDWPGTTFRPHIPGARIISCADWSKIDFFTRDWSYTVLISILQLFFNMIIGV